MQSALYLTQDEETPLMGACGFGSAATARVLLDHGAKVDYQEKVRDLEHIHTLGMVI